MKQKLFAALKTKYSNLGLTDAILNGFAAMLAKTTTEDAQIQTAVDGVEDDLKLLQSDSDKTRAEQARLKKELEDYKLAHPEKKDPPPKDKKPVKKKKPDDEDDDEDEEVVPAWAKKMSEDNAALLTKLNGMEAEKVAQLNQKTLGEKLAEKKVDVKHPLVAIALEGKTFKDEAEINAFVDKMAPAFTKTVQQQADDSLTGIGMHTNGTGLPGSGAANEVSPATKAYLETMKKTKTDQTAVVNK